MASGYTDYSEARHLDKEFGNTNYTAAATHYFGLFTAMPTDVAGTGTEVAGGSYARVSKTNNTTTWPNASGGTKSNGVVITFPTPTADWGNCVGFGIWDAASAGNLIAYGTLDTARNVTSTSTAPSFAVGDLQLLQN